MAVRITHTNNSQGHDGTYVYRSTSPMDPQNLPAPIANEPPVALGATFEYIDNDVGQDDYYYRTQDHEGGQVSAVSAEVAISLAPDYASAAVGDEIGGGIYAGIDTIGATDYYIIAGKAASEAITIQWKTSQTTTAGTASDTDGLANTDAMVAAGVSDHPAADHCVNYAGGGHNDWHMPALSQLTLMTSNLASHPEFSDNKSSRDFTWSSSEDSTDSAKGRFFVDGSEFNYLKDSIFKRRVRPVRRVAV